MSLAGVSTTVVLSQISVIVLGKLIFLSFRHAPSSGRVSISTMSGASDGTSITTSSVKSIIGYSEEVSVHQIACHFNLLHFWGKTPGNLEEDAHRPPANLLS